MDLRLSESVCCGHFLKIKFQGWLKSSEKSGAWPKRAKIVLHTEIGLMESKDVKIWLSIMWNTFRELKLKIWLKYVKENWAWQKRVKNRSKQGKVNHFFVYQSCLTPLGSLISKFGLSTLEKIKLGLKGLKCSPSF